jgi:SAM-dependent methyltransferase
LSDFKDYSAKRAAHWDDLARQNSRWRGLGGYYHRRIAEIFANLVMPGRRVLEIGCGEGDLLASLKPAVGVGVDFSAGMIEAARRKHPQLHFLQADAHELPLEETFDVILLSDLVNDLYDVQAVLEKVRRLCHPRTRVVLNFHSRVWELPLRAAQKLRLAQRVPEQNWLTVEDVRNLLHLAGFEAIRSSQEILWPLRTPLVDAFCNRFLVKFWPLRHLCWANVMVARPLGVPEADVPAPSVSVVVPARNEAGNIDAILQRVPEMGAGTEIVFVEGHSTDDTCAAIERAIAQNPQRRCTLLRQEGRGKGDAVRLGFARAAGDILMILDADLTVAPEDLPRFYDALVARRAEFVNGVRLVYPMEAQAMRFLNLLGNKFFSMAYSWLLGQSVKDTLCGTKVLWKRDYELIAANRAYFGDFDPFGDFDLLFGAARLNLRIVDMPVRYAARTYGKTNISRFRHGLLLLRMMGVAARRLKFV